MSGSQQTRALARRYFDTLNARDWDSFGALLADDVVYEIPQTGERITSRQRVVQFNQEYPGDWRLSVTRLIADGETVAASMNVTDGDEGVVALVYFEFRADLITRVTDFWPETYPPPPGREHLVEHGLTGPDRFVGILRVP